jgi:hypothetical protein
VPGIAITEHLPRLAQRADRYFDEAVKWQKKALEFPDLIEKIATEYRTRLKLYEGRKPYHQE